ncbi:MAG: LLM class flavin-dependent oxidoreductase [Actinomycetota bacterium]
MSRVPIGAMFRRERPPEELITFARFCEDIGLDELWVVEDCFWAGGLTAASAALASTSSITVGMGIVPAVARNPSIAAMEMAGIARMFPGRFVAGFGHGVADWMRQIGALPDSQLAALGETVALVRRMFAGERVTTTGAHACAEDVELVFPPVVRPPILAGVTGPRSIEAMAAVADGLLLPEGSSPAYVRAACARLPAGAPCVVYSLFAVADDAAAAHDQVRVAVDRFAATGLDERLAKLGVVEHVPAEERIARYAIAGSSAECAAAIDRLVAAGATSVVLVPQFDDHEQQLAAAMTEIVPLLGR